MIPFIIISGFLLGHLTRKKKMKKTGNKNADFVVEFLKNNARSIGLNPVIAINQIRQESAFNPLAYNRSSGAKGLGQFMPATWEDFGKGDIYNPEDNLRAYLRLMEHLIKKFPGRIDLVLAGYNWGQNRKLLKEAFDEKIPFSKIAGKLPEETKNYVKKIMQL